MVLQKKYRFSAVIKISTVTIDTFANKTKIIDNVRKRIRTSRGGELYEGHICTILIVEKWSRCRKK